MLPQRIKILISIGIASSILALLVMMQEEPLSKKTDQIIMKLCKPSYVDGISFNIQDNQPRKFTITKKNNSWMLENKMIDTLANKESVSRLLDNLCTVRIMKQIPPKNFNKFGLADEASSIRITSKEQSASEAKIITIGNRHNYSRATFISVSDKSDIFMISAQLWDLIHQPLDYFLDKNTLNQ